MLLYITTGEPRDREIKPLHSIPDTVNHLFDMAMREHLRPAVETHPEGDGWAKTPDWRFDRQVIRVALFLKERLGVADNDRVAIVGPLSPLWLLVDFATQGLQAVPVGLHHGLSDKQLSQALADIGARVVFATDQESADRLVGLRPLQIFEHAVIPESKDAGSEGIIGLKFVWDRGEILDTAERASNWRYTARQVEPDQVVAIHLTPGPDSDVIRDELNHGEAMDFVRDRLERCPAMQDDVAYYEADHVTMVTRLSYYTYVGDGYTVNALRGHRDTRGFAALKPARIVASPEWLTGLSNDLEHITGLGRARRRREHLDAVMGGAVRWAESTSSLDPEVETRLIEAGVPLAAGAPVTPGRSANG